MCLGSSKAPPPPPPPQEVKQPETQALRDTSKRNRAAGAGMAGGSLLTGPSGIAPGMMSTGKSSLLGQ